MGPFLERNKSRVTPRGAYLDGITELLETSDEAPGPHGFGPAIEVIGTEIVVEGAVLEHVVGGGQDRGGEGADRLFRAVSGGQATELRLEIPAVFAGGRPGALDPVVLSQGAPLRMRLDRRLPALSSFLGPRPAQEIRCIDVLEVQPAAGAVVIGHPAAQRRGRGLDPAMGERGQGLGIALARDQSLNHRPCPEKPQECRPRLRP